MHILPKYKIYPLMIMFGLCLAVLYMGPLRPDNILAVQWTGYAGFILLLGAWCLARLIRKERIVSTAVDATLLGLLAAFILATVLSVDPRRSASLTVQVAFYLLVFLMVADLIAHGWERKAWIDALLWTSGLVSLLSLLEVAFWYYAWYSLGGAAHPLPPFNYRLTSWLGHPNMYAGMVIGLAPLAIAQWLQDRRFLVRLGLAAWGLMAVINLVFASSRGGWLVLGGTLALLILLLVYPRLREGEWLKHIHLPRINWLLVIAVLLGVVVLAGVGFVALRMLRNPTHASFLLSRSGFWPVAWDMFVSSPLFGTGPETYYRFWLAARSYALNGLANNPINIYLTLAAETGLVGLGTFLLVIGLAARKVSKVYQSASASERLWIAACASGLIGILVHGVTEITAVLYPAILFLLILAALLLSYGPAPARRTPAWLPLGLLVLAAGFIIYTGRGQAKFEQALQAGQMGQWQQAAELSEQAAQLDTAFAWYPLQAGYARGMAALSQPGQPDMAQLKLAIQDYQAGIPLEPAYALNYANLASLFWQTGDHPAAIAQMKQAVQRDPSESVFLYNLGWMLETSGDQKDAADAYTRALQADPLLGDAPVWNTPTRQAIHTGEPPAGLETEIKAMDVTQLTQARQQYEQQRATNPFMPIPYRGLGLIAWQSGDLKLAEYDLNVSTRAFGDFTDHYTRQEAFLDLSDLAASQGQTAQAIAYGMQAFDAIDQYNLTGPGSLGDNPYAAWVFHRSSLPGDVLPGLLRPDMSTRLALRYIALGDRLQADGQIAGACRIYQRVLQSVPDLADGIAAVKQYCGKIR